MSVSALFVGGQVIPEKPLPGSEQCDPSRNQLRSDLVDVANTFPGTLSPATAWVDSTSSELCVGGMPGKASVIRHFVVIGDTVVRAERAIAIARRDSAMITAEGTVEQHATTIRGAGQSNVLLYVSEASGRVLRVTKDQLLRLSVTAEGRTRTFVQQLTSALELER